MRNFVLSVIAAALLSVAAVGSVLGAHPHHLTTPAGCVDLANGGDPGSAYWLHHDTATGSWWAVGHGAIHNHVHKTGPTTLAPAAAHNPNQLTIGACA